MSKFDELISNLKRDIQSIPSLDGSSTHQKECIPVSVPIQAADTASIVIPVLEQKHHNKYFSLFVRHGLLSAEFVLFFLIFLSITKPSFLYYKERVVQNGREFWKTHFSFLYLFSYSLLFAGLFHLLIFIQKDLVKKYR